MTPTFPTTFLKEGYEPSEVDLFLERLARMDPADRPAAAREVRFTPVRLKRGYECGAVDAHLESLY